tara:strand:- start:436 stop:756 length:321 start_codon:yes stop_codon:yes gene_type:complete
MKNKKIREQAFKYAQNDIGCTDTDRKNAFIAGVQWYKHELKYKKWAKKNNKELQVSTFDFHINGAKFEINQEVRDELKNELEELLRKTNKRRAQIILKHNVSKMRL